jgi:hypothetical protein
MPKLEMEQHECNNCLKKVWMHVEDRVTATVIEETGDKEHPVIPINFEITLLTCPACNGLNITLREVDSDDEIVIYPAKIERKRELLGLPSNISQAYQVAQKVRNIDTNLFGVQLGRVLDLICIDKNAKGKNLIDRISDLASQNEIPPRLAEMAHKLRQLRNIGAHADAGELTPAEIPILDALCEAILEYLYHAPKFIEQVEERIKNLKTNSH